ncbi:gene transfer agent family protein [Sphingobium sp. CCH11-B1]|uniref:gene transfer agent family protein n=1 Tax=Sphingobium sp. CCH11-B1 TaxID=1768781 RepID=UPI000834DE1F|nr:gene transfer agent family protein [Sphingobium sp. CCH11-B1]
MQTEITLPFADGEYLFRLPIKRIVEIEAKTGPIDLVKHRLMQGGWSIHDVVETIRQGLIGGARGEVNGVSVEVTALRANSLIENYVDNHALAEHHITAKAIIAALYVGYAPAQEAKKKAPVKPRSRKASTGASSSTTSEPSASA